jgi:hypothetical protein
MVKEFKSQLMKNISVAIFLVASLFACTNEKEEPQLLNCEFFNGFDCEKFCSGEINLAEETYPQMWYLVKMNGNVSNSETTGENMPWQEYILLNADSTFTKHRERDSIVSEESGTFTYEIGKSNPPYVQLSLRYNSANELVGNCYGDPLFEAYWLDTKCTLQGTWSHCDGPGLSYKRIFENCGSGEVASDNN